MLWKVTCMKLTFRLQVTETRSQNDITTIESKMAYFKLREVGTPGRIRTPDPLVRSEMLYPAELRAHNGVSGGIRTLDLQGHNLTC